MCVFRTFSSSKKVHKNMFSSTFSLLAHSLHRLQKTAFKSKVAETSCNSLGLSKELVRNAYREAEGLVGYIKTIREENKKSSSASSSKEIFKNQKENYASLIFNNDSVSPSYLETISSEWPKKWFRHVGDRKCQVQIPLSKLMTPGKYFSTNNATTPSIPSCSSSWITQGSSSSSKNNNDGHEHITLPPHLQALAVTFEQVASNYLEELLEKKKLIPSSFEKGLFPSTAADVQENNKMDYRKEERSSLLAKMKNKSVLRLWIYFGDETRRCSSEKGDEKKEGEKDFTNRQQRKEESCRGHFDPGVVSVLLAGSEPGLQVHKTFTGMALSSEKHDGKKKKNFDQQQQQEQKYEYVTHDATNQADEEGWVNIGYDNTTHSVDANSNNNSTTIPSPSFCDTNVVLMNDTLLQVLTGGVAEHCFHRVVINNDDNKKNNNNNKNKNKNRIQIVLELRPDHADKWYKFAPTEDEKKELMKAWRQL